jgi:endonuclease/exonuclease/phosphatase (EEP) superfamily protein YafD
VTILAVGCLAVALAGLLAHHCATSWQPVVVAASFARPAMWFALPGAVLAAVAGQGAWAAVGAVATAAVLSVQVPDHLRHPVAADAPAVTLLQANLKLGAADPHALVRLVRRHAVELLAVEELPAAAEQGLLAAGIGDLLPHRHTRPGHAGVGIWSRYPLHDLASEPGFQLGLLHARALLPTGALTLAAVHLTPPVRYPVRDWLGEMHRLRELLVALPAPTLAAGDFNATVNHRQFRRLLRCGYAGAAAQSGAGYLATYPAGRWRRPIIGVDHVLIRGAAALSVRRVPLPGSDHCGILARIAIPGGQAP